MSNSVFSDFCQAWVARFPGSELPAAWEEDVRANLKKHKAKVAVLKEEIEKEEMYVEYLDKLLLDIERHKQGKDQGLLISNSQEVTDFQEGDEAQERALNEENKRKSIELANKQQFLEDHLQNFKERSGLQLDLTDVSKSAGNSENLEETSFVTVINVSSAKGGGAAENRRTTAEEDPGANNTYTKTRKAKSEAALKRTPPKPPPKRSLGSRDSLNSVSSPTTPTSPMISSLDDFPGSIAREGIDTLSPRDPLLSGKLSSSSEDETGDTQNDFILRGRPDGKDNEDPTVKKSPSPGATADAIGGSKVNKIKELMANWENKPPITARPKPRVPASDGIKKNGEDQSPVGSQVAKRKDSDSSSRGRMGSPGGKSHHDSSDGEASWPRQASDVSPGARRKIPGETRLDRLVRRTSGERPNSRQAESLPLAPPPAIPAASKKPVAVPRRSFSTKESTSLDEPLYDTVANDEPEDEYDNHLLYGSKGKTDTLGSSGAGSISADLGFDEPIHSTMAQSGQSLNGSGTLSSSDTDGFSAAASPSLRRGISLEEETNYVNIQYFLQSRQKAKSSTSAMDTILSDEEFSQVESKASSSSSRETLDGKPVPLPRIPVPPQPQQPDASEAERIMMYKCILNSIVDSESIYLEGLSVMLQYMKAMKMTLATAQPVIPKEEFDIIFFKIPELHDLHLTFHETLKKQVDRWNGVDSIGHTFKMLATRTKIYKAFLNNYQRALESLHKCTEAYPQFADLTRSIKLRTVKGQRQGQSLSLEDLLHKPVARVQKLILCLQDLIKYTPDSHSDFVTLSEALDHVQTFLHEYNVMHASELFPHQERQQRHLVKNSFIVELSEGQRKLRHLFLFNDVLVCAKYKASSKSSEKFTFQLKWHIPLWNVSIAFLLSLTST